MSALAWSRQPKNKPAGSADTCRLPDTDLPRGRGSYDSASAAYPFPRILFLEEKHLVCPETLVLPDISTRLPTMPILSR